MTGNTTLALAATLPVFLFGCATASHHSAASHSVSGFSSTPIRIPVAAGDWQTTLREDVTNGAWMVGSARLGVQYNSVPAEAAKILENLPPAELLPFLAQLRTSTTYWQTNVLDVWAGIVREGLHGTPYTITNSYALINNRGQLLPIFNNMFGGPRRFGPPIPPIFTNWIPVYNYTDKDSRPIRANATSEDEDILEFAQKNPGYYIKEPKYGDPHLVEVVEKLSDIPRPWTVPKMIRLFEDEKGEKSQYSARVLAASRDPRAALVLGNALDNLGFDKSYASFSALFDYFVEDDSYGLPPENRFYLRAGNALDLDIPATRRWWAINRRQIEAEADKMRTP